MPVYMGAHMLADGGTTKLDPSLVAKFPEAFDFKNDIFIPGKIERYSSQLTSALQSRGLLMHLVERLPTLQEIAAQNPNASGAEVSEAYDDICSARQKAQTAAAPFLLAMDTPDSTLDRKYEETGNRRPNSRLVSPIDPYDDGLRMLETENGK